MLMGSSSRSPVGGDAPASPKYSDRLSPAINNYLSEASRQEVRVGFFSFLGGRSYIEKPMLSVLSIGILLLHLDCEVIFV